MPMQALVIAHACYGHNSFFKGNYLFRAWTQSDAIVDYLLFSKQYILECERRYGEVLVEAGILAPVEVYRAIREHIEAIVWSLFSWEDGAVLFSIGDFSSPGNRVRVELPMPQVILQGIKRAPNARALVSRLGKKETVFEPTWDHETLIEGGLEAADVKGLDGLRPPHGGRSRSWSGIDCGPPNVRDSHVHGDSQR